MSTTPDGNRVSTRLGEIEFEYEFPFISVDTSINQKDFELLRPDPNEDFADVEQGPMEPVTQYLGPSPTKVTMRGHCYIDEANQIDGLDDGQVVSLRSERIRSRVLVESTATNPRGSGGGVRDGVENRVYDYRIEATVVEGGQYNRTEYANVPDQDARRLLRSHE